MYTVASKQMLISLAPPVLTLHLKRFQQARFTLRKLTKHVDFPLELNLAPFCSRSGKVSWGRWIWPGQRVVFVGFVSLRQLGEGFLGVAWRGIRVLWGRLVCYYVKEHLCRIVLTLTLIFACLIVAFLSSGSLLPCEQALRLGIRYSDVNSACRASILSPSTCSTIPVWGLRAGGGAGENQQVCVDH